MPKKNELKCHFGCTIDGPIHRFPKWEYPHEERFNSWKAVLKLAIQEKGNEYIYNNIRLCYRHFENCFQLPSHQLTRNAVPTLNISLPEQAVLNNATTSGTNVFAPIMDQPEVNSLSKEENVVVPHVSSLSAVPQNTTNDIKTYREVKGSRFLEATSYTHKHIKSRDSVREISLLKEKILKLRNKCKTQTMKIRMAEKISKTKVFLETIERLPEPIKIFTNLQLKHTKKPKGRKYSLKEKILSLTILKQSPKAYNLLRKLFILPSKRTLQKLLSCVVLKPGINNHIINNLKKSAAKLPEEKKLCSLIFDEVALAPGVYYNNVLKEIIGFEDYGYVRTPKIADHALVLMIKSIKGKYKEPISFTFCQGATKKEHLKVILKEAIRAVTTTGLKIICTVCDQSSTNMSTIKNLHEETVKDYIKRGEEYRSHGFEIDGNRIFPLFDPPHLLKGMRNNLLSKNLRYIENGIVKTAKWEHIHMFMEKDVEKDELRLVNKLTESHIIKDKIPKMKVKYAAQVFSQRLSAAIKFCARHDILPKECHDTADLLCMVDKLFDSFNGHSYKEHQKKFRSCLKNGSPHFKLWDQLLPVLRSMGYETKKKDGSIIYRKVPSIKNWIHNIQVYKELWPYLKSNFHVTSILTRNLNQDPLENFFCKIRSNGVRNTNPTCGHFVNAYKTLVINNFATPHSVNANCEDDNGTMLQSIETFLKEDACTLQNRVHEGMDINNLLQELETPAEPAQEREDFLNNESKKYVAGSVLKKARTKIFKSCPVCTKDLIKNEGDETSYIYQRDYTKKALTYPSSEFTKLMKSIFEVISRCIQESPESPNLEDIIKFNIDILCDFQIMTCQVHVSVLRKFIISLAVNIALHSWCAGVTKILKGKLCKFNKNDKVKADAYNYYKSHYKNKNK